ncbi:MAG: hypothetical protein KAR87_03670, partial [Candidatus Aenigmarchaeota archaeon]|nr:hypothetical protein [Candidatus Aenigmarchaeota archaeon]
MNKKTFLYAVVLCIVAVFVQTAWCSTISINAGINKHNYLTGEENLSVSGYISEGTGAHNETVTLNVSNSSGVVVSGAASLSNGCFSEILDITNLSNGDYNMTISAGSESIRIDFKVSSTYDIITAFVNSTKPIVSCSPDDSGSGIVEIDSSIGQNLTCNFTVEGDGTYYAIVENSSDTPHYDTLYLDDDKNMTFTNDTMFKYLSEGDKIIVNGTEIMVMFIAHDGSIVTLADKMDSEFTGGEQVKLMTIAVDSDHNPVNNSDTTYKEYWDNGTKKFEQSAGTTPENGTLLMDYNVSSDGGKNHIVVNDMGYISNDVNIMTVKVDIKTEEGTSFWKAKTGQVAVLEASVMNSSSYEIINTSVVTAKIVNSNTTTGVTLVYDSTEKKYLYSYTIPSVEGEYHVKFSVNYSGFVQTRDMKFFVKDTEYFMHAIAKDKGKSTGFAPGQPSALIISAKNSTSDFVNVTNRTSQCSATYVDFVGIYDSAKTLINSSIIGISTISAFMDDMDIPTFVRYDIEDQFGEDACVIKFMTPSSNGVYSIKVTVNDTVTGSLSELKTLIPIQDVDAFAMPVNENGVFNPAYSSGENMYLAIQAFDLYTGAPISEENITDAQIIEIYSQSAGKAVTDKITYEGFIGGNVSSKTAPKINFSLNTTDMGMHFVAIKIKANVTRDGAVQEINAIARGWFERRLYKINVWPHCGGDVKMCVFGSDGTVSVKVGVRDASGTSAQAGVSVSIAGLRHIESGKIISTNDLTGTSTSCTTNSTEYIGSNNNVTNPDYGVCTLSFSYSAGFDAGKYELQVKATNPADSSSSDTGRGVFDVRNFMFDLWTDQFEIASGDDVTFNVVLKNFEGVGLSGVVTAEKLIYYGTFDMWNEPVVINDSLGLSGAINGTGNITLPSMALKQGAYSLAFKAVANGSTQYRDAWFYSKPFVLTAQLNIGGENNWDRIIGTGDTANFTVKGLENVNWNTWPPTGSNHNLSATWVKKIIREGMMGGNEFKTRSEMESQNNMSYSCSGNVCYLTFNMSDFTQGEYMIEIAANDTDGNTASAWEWTNVMQLRFGIPQLMDWTRVSDATKRRSTTYLSLSGDWSNIQDEFKNKSSNITTCKVASDYGWMRIIGKMNNSMENSEYPPTYYLLDKTNSSDPRLYINTTGWNYINAPNYTTGQIFMDSAGFSWNITSIDASENKVYVDFMDGFIVAECPDCSVSSDDANANPNQQNMPLIINKSLSISGKILQGQLRDEQWLGLNLNNDADYWDNYIIVMIDTAVSGIYDTVYISNSTNVTRDGILASSGLPVGFNGAKPTYLVSSVYTAGTGYQLSFSTYKSGWGGMQMGTFPPTEQSIKIPVLVTSPSNESEYKNNATVVLDSLMQMSMTGPVTIPITGVNDTTNQYGFALIEFNISAVDINTGSYFLNIKVKENDSNEWVENTAIWNNPRINVRNFVVSNYIGLKGQINNMVQWNITSLESSEFFALKTDSMHQEGDGWYRPDDWTYQSIYYNISNNTIVIDNNSNHNVEINTDKTYYDANESLIEVTLEGGNTGYFNITLIREEDNYVTTISVDNATHIGSRTEKGFIFAVYDVNATVPASAKINITPMGYNFMQVRGETINIGTTVLWGLFNTTSITNNSVGLTWVKNAITVKSIWINDSDVAVAGQGDDGPKMLRIVNVANTDYSLLAFKNASVNSSQHEQWENNMFYVINRTSRQIVTAYQKGQQMSELYDWAVLKSDIWDRKISVSNQSINGSIIYPMPWTCDDSPVYVGNFTESSANVKVTESDGGPGEQSPLDNSTQYYIMVY